MSVFVISEGFSSKHCKCRIWQYLFSSPTCDKRHLIHACVDRPNIIGENLAMRTATNIGYSVEEAVASWYARGLAYDYTNERTNPATGEEQLDNEH